MDAHGDDSVHYDYDAVDDAGQAAADAQDPNTLPSLQQHPAAPPSEPVKPKRAHVAAACIFCKGRKMRCDGARPTCSNCQNRNLECAYPEAPRTRGPSKAKPLPAPAALPESPHSHHIPYAMNGSVVYYPHPGMIAPDGTMLSPGPLPHPPQRSRIKRSASEMEGEGDGDDIDADGEDDPTSSKKRNPLRGGKRAQMACHSCRARKMKCDELQPACSQCARRHIACAYDDFVRRRGPSKKKREEAGDPANTHPPHPHVHPPHGMGLVHMHLPGAHPDAPKYMALIDPNGVPVQILGLDPSLQQMVPVQPPPGMVMHHGQRHSGEPGIDRDDNEENDGSGNEASQNGDDDTSSEQHTQQQQPVIWS